MLLAWSPAAGVDMPTKPATPCTRPGCPNLKPCQDHMRQAERARGTRQQRGYTSRHDTLRNNWKPRVEAGLVDCQNPVCLMPIRRILLGQQWQLGHTPDRTKWRGPEHTLCNASEGGRMSHHST